MAVVLWLEQIRLDQVDVISNLRKVFEPEKMRELEASIKAHGVRQPVLVTIQDNGRYRLVAGERRVRAARAVGLEAVPAMVQEMTDAEIVEAQVTENLQREDVSAIEEAEGFRQLVEVCKMTQEQVAKRIGISQSQVANRLRLLRLPKDVQDRIIARQITAGHGMALLRLMPDGKAKPGPLFDDVVKRMTEGEISVQRGQAEVDDLIWSRGRALVQTKQQNPSWQPYHETLFDPKAECLENPKSGRCPYVIDVKPKGYAKAELRCVSPKCWESKQKAAWARIEGARKKAEAEKAAKKPKSQKTAAEKKPPATPAPKAPPAPPLENIDVREVGRLGRLAWQLKAQYNYYSRDAIEMRREAYLSTEDLLKHFKARAALRASKMPSTMGDMTLSIPEQQISMTSVGDPAKSAVLALDRTLDQFKFRTASHYGGQLTLLDAAPTGPVYYCATLRWSTQGLLEQRLAIPLKGRTLVIVAQDGVMIRKDLRPRWSDLLNGLPASPVSCIPGGAPAESDGDAEGVQDDSLVEAVGYQAGDSVTQYGYQGSDGRVFIVDDGLAQGEEWGVFEVRPNNALHRVKSIPMTPDPEKADEALEAWAAKRRMTPVYVTRSEDSVATRPRETQEADSPALLDVRKSILDRPDDERADKPLACKDCGLRPCGPDTRKLCKGEAAG